MPKDQVLFLVPYPMRRAPSQRFRVELFLPHLKSAGFDYKVSSFLDERTFSVLYSNASFFEKSWGVFKGFLKRLWTVLWTSHRYDFVFVHREASPLGPPVFEFVLAKLFRKKIIYDFDDAIWIPDSNNKVLNWFKAFWKIRYLCKWSYKVVGGNEFLCNYARQYNSNVVLIPTSVDIEKHHNRLKDQDEMPLTIGWTGSHSTLKYLDPLVPLLESIASQSSIKVLVICNQPPSFTFPGLEFIQWNEKTEVDDLLRMNIGIMPLPEDAWSEGKCGFKLIQYLSLGIPAAASAVGVNKKIMGTEGASFLCSTMDDWKQALTALVNEKSLRQKLGKSGRERMKAEYSIQANSASFVGLFC